MEFQHCVRFYLPVTFLRAKLHRRFTTKIFSTLRGFELVPMKITQKIVGPPVLHDINFCAVARSKESPLRNSAKTSKGKDVPRLASIFHVGHNFWRICFASSVKTPDCGKRVCSKCFVFKDARSKCNFFFFQRTSSLPTSFPGSLIFPPPGAREKRPWFGLVTCLPDFSRLQISGLREGQISGEFVST